MRSTAKRRSASTSLQKTEVANSNRIELEAFQRAIGACLRQVGELDILVTDQKRDIMKYVKDHLNDKIKSHTLDMFHVKKGTCALSAADLIATVGRL